MSEKPTMPKNVQAFVDKYGGIGSKEQDAAFWKEFRKAANAYANVQAKRICDLERALAEARGQRDRLAELHNKNAIHYNELLELCGTLRKGRDRLAKALQNVIDEDGTPMSIDRANTALQSLTPNHP